MATIRQVSCYLVLERDPRWYQWPRIVKMAKNSPSLESGQVAVKVRLNVPMELFNEMIPEVDVDVESVDQFLGLEASLESHDSETGEQ